MSIETRKVKNTTYVTETRRVGPKTVKTHLGKLDAPYALFLVRKSRLQAGVTKRLRRESGQTRKASVRIEERMGLLAEFAERCDPLHQLSQKLEWSRKPMTNTSQENLDAQQIKQAIHALPSKHAFEELCRNADMGDPEAMETFDRLIEQTPELLDSVADLIELAKALVIQDTSATSYLMKLGIEQKLSKLLNSMAESGENDAIKIMNAEILVVSYLDAMRCGLLASRRYDTKSEAEHFQRLADRSMRRYERAQKVYSRYQ